MSIPRFLAMNTSSFCELNCYGLSDVSIFDALKKFNQSHLDKVARHLGIRPRETVEVQLWDTQGAVFNGYLHWRFAKKVLTINVTWMG